MVKETKRFLVAVSVLVGTCIGAGVLGIPYVAAQSGFFVTLAYILLLGLIVLAVNLYIGEIALRTKGDHQLIGYTKRYLGKKWKHVMEFAIVFGAYAAIIAYMLGMGESLSFLFFGTVKHSIWLGVIIGLLMAFLIKGGIKMLKKFEKYGVLIILSLLIIIFAVFINKIELVNLFLYNPMNVFLPFGVVLFALMSFHAIPEVKIVLKRKEKLFRKVMLTGTLISVSFYILFTFVVVGFQGAQTPEIATLTLGGIFIFLGIFTMFTSYLASGNALIDNFVFDERWSRKWAWVFAAIVPIVIFILTQLTNFFSFVTILSIGGVISGGILATLVLFMIKRAKKQGNRKPEYSVPAKWWIVILLSLIFIFGVIREIFLVFRY